MPNESSTSYQFELLDTSSQNWFSWKTKMEAYLEEHDLEDIVAKDGLVMCRAWLQALKTWLLSPQSLCPAEPD